MQRTFWTVARLSFKTATGLSVISYQLSVISYQLSVISHQLSVISYQLSVISYLGVSESPIS
ncbi:MAG: hypothetical protein EWV89_01530 [Microcystis wesenbergii Mw_QC_B_20070930_S4]|nr:MAG: hypothetical protein EWV73_10410 [Microcystis wesenbergii Mw_QC_B_20070930_S4D]TRV17787.1 MAG: hypothetical protein EWV89_01530 [Microcystis wesenbergii Mw_QC_B_20070930_S4]